MADQRRQATLAKQQEALWDYLDALLQDEVPEQVETAAPVVEEPVVREAVAPPVVEREVPVEVEVPAPSAEVYAEPVGEALAEQAAEAREAGATDETRDANGVPAWARPDFQALLFEVQGLSLAVPLVKLQSVVPWTEDLAAMPKQPAWCHGLFRYRGKNVKVVDTARMVLPPHKFDPNDEAARPTQILIVGDGTWGLSCVTVGQVVRLGPKDVKWRTDQGKRPWLSGTVLKHLCALMDTEAFATMLDHGGRTN